MYLFMYGYSVKTFKNIGHYSETIVQNNITEQIMCTYLPIEAGKMFI
jgi:hypothetical protein